VGGFDFVKSVIFRCSYFLRKSSMVFLRGSKETVTSFLNSSGLFYLVYLTTLSVAQTRYRRIKGWYVNYELVRMWKEAVLRRNLPGGIEENRENLNQDFQSSGRDLNPGLPENSIGIFHMLLQRV
jgi:hypothetical protein